MSSTYVFSDSISKEKLIDVNHANKFERLVVQDNGGRLKPVNTLCSEYLLKIYGKDNFEGQSSTQVILGMINDPVIWSKVGLIKISNNEIRLLLKKNDLKSRYLRISFNDFFSENGSYLLTKSVEDAYSKLPRNRSKYDNEIIKIDERVNICFMIFNAGIFRFFPLPDDPNNTWLAFSSVKEFKGNDSLFVANIMPMYYRSLKESFKNNNWSVSDSIITYISKYQMKYGVNVIPKQYKIDLEILYNKLKIFSRLFIYYFISGLVLIILLITKIFRPSLFINRLIKTLKWVVFIGFIGHTIGLIMRWVISEHAPWSDGYESMIYIAWATLLAGFLFSKHSLLTLAATSVVSSLLLMVAHLNWLDPEITNLVPVLDSYWLMIHVSIITASYGFFALASVLGLIALWLIIFTTTNNKNKLKTPLDELTIINDKALEVGLFMLTTGTFLGGIWANESWGRYWGWDPKETWAFISVLIYVFVLHMRFIPSLKSKYLFNTASMFAIWTIIMTYFGVNYYLSGLHSYAAGDPMPIPSFVYYLLTLMVVTSLLARFNYKKYY